MNKKSKYLSKIIKGIIYTAVIMLIYSFVSNKTFSYSTPSNWINMDSKELKTYEDAYIQSGSQKVKEYSGESFNISINEIKGLHSKDNKVKLVLVDMFIPNNSSSYINDMYKESTQKFKWGLDNGQLSKINENKLTTFKDRECYLNDFELNSGMRMITYLLPNDSIIENVYQIGIFIDPNTIYKNYQSGINQILESLEISNK